MTSQTTTNQDALYNQLLCAQITAKRQLQLTTIPPARIELQNTPYTNYTKYELDMRRKAEILKYNSNAQSNQTNNMTRSQKWSGIVNGNGPVKQSRINALINNPNTQCPNDALIPTPTSSSDVPGPIIQLIDDESVPLYNYSTNIDAYSTIGAQTNYQA
jgi:hypothetical protein